MIKVELDEAARRLSASATITYKNNSPDSLEFLWVHLDQNIFRKDSIKELTSDFGGTGRRGPATAAPGGGDPAKLSFGELRRQQGFDDRDYGFEIVAVTLKNGADLDHTIVGTLMRIDPKIPLAPGAELSFSIEWAYNIVEEDAIGARSGYEHFPDDKRKGGNDIFLLAQWFPGWRPIPITKAGTTRSSSGEASLLSSSVTTMSQSPFLTIILFHPPACCKIPMKP